MVSAVLVCAMARPSALERGTLPKDTGKPIVARRARTLDTESLPGTLSLGSFAPGSGPAPANNDLAVGPGAIVHVTQDRIRFLDKELGVTFDQSAAKFFSGLAQTPAPQEPRAFYDDTNGRFFVLFVENDVPARVCNFLIAVSDDSDPSGAWHQYVVDARRIIGESSYWLSRPSIGCNSTGIQITGTYTDYDTGLVSGSGFFLAPSAPFYAGTASTITRFVDSNSPYAQTCETLGADQQYVFGAARKTHVVIRVYRTQNVGQSNPLVRFSDENGANSPMPPVSVPSTGGASLETQTNRSIGLAWRDNRLLIANNSGSSIVGIRHLVFDTTDYIFNPLTIVASALASSPTTHYFLPAAGLNKWGDVGVMYSGSSSALTSDILWSGRTTSDHPGYFSPPSLLASAEGSPYLDSRWGVYSDVDVDPFDGETFWGTTMVVGADGWWRSKVVKWTVSKTMPLAPSTFAWVRGAWQSGNAASLANDDDDYNVAKAGLVLFPSEAPAQLVLEAVAPVGDVLRAELQVRAKTNSPGLAQRIELFNWTTGAYVTMGTQPATTTESSQSVVVTANLGDYVQAGTRTVRAKVSWYRTGLTLVWPWTVSVDQAKWNLRMR